MLFLKSFNDAKFGIDGNAFQTFITIDVMTFRTIYEIVIILF